VTAPDLHAALNRVSDGVLVLDPDWVVTFVNAAGARLLQSTVEDMVGRNIWAQFPEAVGSTFQQNYELAMSTQQTVEFEEYFGPLEGIFAIRAFPAADGVTIYFQNVTQLRELEDEREQALSALREAHAMRVRFEALVEASSDFIAIAGLDGQVLYVNPRGRAMIGMAPEFDVSQTTIADYLTPEGVEASIAIEQPAVVRDGQWTGETTLRDYRGGTPIPVMVSSFLMRDAETGEPFALATVQRDITARIAASEKLQQVAAQRQELLHRLVAAQEQERARIAADVHDDSVQALAVVDLRLSVLQRKLAEAAPQFNDQVSQLQLAVSTATDRLRLLLFELESADESTALIDCLREAAAHLFEDTALTWSFDGDLDADLPVAERGQAVRVAKEALTNARNHASATTVEIHLIRVGDGVEVAVVDDGIGVDPETAKSPPGHRGLATMRDRVEVAGGWWQLERTGNGGTTVRFWLPGVPTD